MKMVIDIPEDVYKRTVFYREFRDLNDCVTTIKALEKAIPLPEHHGRLIDADDLLNQFPMFIDNVSSVNINKTILKAPTIIERSDKE